MNTSEIINQIANDKHLPKKDVKAIIEPTIPIFKPNYSMVENIQFRASAHSRRKRAPQRKGAIHRRAQQWTSPNTKP